MLGWLNLNTNGSSKDNGTSGCGRVLQGFDGEWLGGFAKSLV